MRLASLLICLGTVCAGERTVPPIIELARAAPPEFFADAVLRVIQAGQIPQRDAQVELLEEAFSVAADAKESVRLIGLPGVPPDTREIYRSMAGASGLDALSLQARIVKDLLTLDRPKARALFERIPRPKLDPRPCADPFVADASPYYEAAAAIAQSAFSEREKQSELHVQFLSSLLTGARSPNEIAAYARSLQSIGLSTSQWRLLVAGIRAKLESISADYRPFAMSVDATQSELAGLIDSGADDLNRSFRKYLVNQLTAPRCAPDIALGLEQVHWLNPPLTEDESKPAKRLERFQIVASYFDSDDSRQIGDALNRLRAAKDKRSQLFADFTRDFAAWRPDGSEIDLFHQKATVLRALLEVTPRGDDRNRVVNLCVAFLQSTGAERQAPAEWLWEVRSIVEKAGADAPRLLAAFESSTSVSLSLYAKLGYFGVSSGTSK